MYFNPLLWPVGTLCGWTPDYSVISNVMPLTLGSGHIGLPRTTPSTGPSCTQSKPAAPSASKAQPPWLRLEAASQATGLA